MYMADNQHLMILKLQVRASMMEFDLKFFLTIVVLNILGIRYKYNYGNRSFFRKKGHYNSRRIVPT